MVVGIIKRRQIGKILDSRSAALRNSRGKNGPDHYGMTFALKALGAAL